MTALATIPPATAPAKKLLTKPALRVKLNMSDSAIWRLEHHGDFPKRIRIGGKVYYLESEVDQWIEAQAATRESAA